MILVKIAIQNYISCFVVAFKLSFSNEHFCKPYFLFLNVPHSDDTV